ASSASGSARPRRTGCWAGPSCRRSRPRRPGASPEMLDIRTIRERADALRDGARKKRIAFDLDRLLAVDDRRRTLLRQVEDRKAGKGGRGRAVGGLPAEKKQAELAELAKLKDSIAAGEAELQQVLAEFEALMLRVPNIPAAEVPEGRDESENVEIRRVGTV